MVDICYFFGCFFLYGFLRSDICVKWKSCFHLDATKGLWNLRTNKDLFKDFMMNQAEHMKIISHYHQQMVSNWYRFDLSRMILCFEVSLQRARALYLQVPPQIGYAFRSHSRLWGAFFFLFGWHRERSDWLFGLNFCLLFVVETNETGSELRFEVNV